MARDQLNVPTAVLGREVRERRGESNFSYFNSFLYIDTFHPFRLTIARATTWADILLTDVLMPNVNGVQFAVALTHARPLL